MTTTEPTYQTSPPRYLTDEYEVVKDGRTFLCQQVRYRGNIYEMCREVNPATDVFTESLAGRSIKPGDPGYDDLVAYLDQFLIPREEGEAE